MSADNGVDTREVKTNLTSHYLNIVGVYVVAVLFIFVGIFLQWGGVINNFFTASNFINILDAVALLGIVSVGMAFVTYSGHYADLSVPTTMAFSGIIGVELLKYGFLPAVLGAICTGIVIGIINGFVIGKLKTNPIIWTLAMSYLTMGIIRFVWVNKQIYPSLITDDQRAVELFDNIYRLRFYDVISMPLILMVLIVIVGQFLLKKTKFGAQLQITGSARRVARFSGIKVEYVIGMVFILSGIAAAVAGLSITSLSRVGAWYNGAGYDFRAVTAVVIGGVTLSGGRGTIVGVLGGTLVIGIMNNIMTLLGIGTFSQDIVRGIVFITVVGINAKNLRSMGRDDA